VSLVFVCGPRDCCCCGRPPQAKRVPKAVLESLAADVVTAQAKFETSRLDLIARLNMLEATKRCALIEQVCSSMYSIRAFFRQCNEAVLEIAPLLQSLQVSVQLARSSADKKSQAWAAIRKDLFAEATAAMSAAVIAPIPKPGGYDPLESYSNSPGPVTLTSFIAGTNAAVPGQSAFSFGATPPTAAGSEPLGSIGVELADSSAMQPVTPGLDTASAECGIDLINRAVSDISDRVKRMVAAEFEEESELFANRSGVSAAPPPPPVEKPINDGGVVLREWGTRSRNASVDTSDRRASHDGGSSVDTEDVCLPSPVVVTGSNSHVSPVTQPDTTDGGPASGEEVAHVSKAALPPSVVPALPNMKPSPVQTPVVIKVDDGILKAGYLYKQGSGVRKDWKKRWFFIRNGKLNYMRSKKNMSPVFVCDLVLTNVRETIGGARNSFEVRVGVFFFLGAVVLL
jgi:BAR domain of APPL family/PH domain